MLARVLVLSLAALALACTERAPAEASTTGSSTGSTAAPTTGEPPTPTTGMSEGTGPVATTGDAPVCEAYTIDIDVALVVPRVMLVLDRSPAMLDPWDHDLDPQTPDEPRWAGVRRALLAEVPGGLPIELGLAGSPTADAVEGAGPAACAVTPELLLAPGAVGPDGLADLLPPESPAPDSFVGGAPLRAAIAAAAELLPSVVDQPRVILVVGSGAANCRADPPDETSLLETLDEGVFAVVEAVQAEGIVIAFVAVGASEQPNPIAVDHRPDGVAPLAMWQELAVKAGNVLQAAASEADLAEILGGIFSGGGELSCVLDLDPAPDADQRVSVVRISGQAFAPVDCQLGDGWWQPTPAQVELCGAACELFQQVGGVEIDVVCRGD